MTTHMNMINVQLPNLEKYKIIGHFGSGSFSHVFKAVRKDTNKLYAIKQFKPQFNKKELYQVVCKEIALLKILSHPNIACIEEYCIKHDLMCIVMEFYALGNLVDYMNNHRGYLTVNNIQAVVSQVASALVYMHSMKIFHGDVKFQNIMVSSLDGPRVKLIDFGLSDVYVDEFASDVKRGGSLYNTAPEVLLGFPFNHTSDLFSLGIVMYTLIYGHAPFRNMGKEMLLTAYKKRTPITFSEEKLVLISQDGLDLVKSLLSYDKQDRLSGDHLLHNPFVRGYKHIRVCDHLTLSKQLIEETFELHRQLKNYGEAYVKCMQSILHLKIHLGSLKNPDKQAVRFFVYKIREYLEYANTLRDLIHGHRDCTALQDIDDERLKVFCQSSPTLMNLLEIGLTGEMYIKEGKHEQALHCLNESVEGFIKQMALEPNGPRKTMIYKKIEFWIEIISSIHFQN